MKELLEISTKLFKFIFFLSFFVGGVIVLTYCIRIGYFPAGIGVGDSLFFIAVAMGFSFIYVLYLGSVSATSLLVVWVFRVPISWVFSHSKARVLFDCNEPRINRFDRSSYLLLLGGLLFALGLYILSYFPEIRDFVISTACLVLIFVFIMVLLLMACRDEEPLINAKLLNLESLKERQRRNVKIFLLFCMTFVPLVYSEVSYQVSKIVFTQIGVSVKNAEIYMDKKMKPKFYGVGKVKDDYLILEDVKILWTGVGSGTVVEVKVNNKLRKYVLKTNEITFSY